MAQVSCLVCRAPARGRAVSFYPALLTDKSRTSVKRFLCVEHARDTVTAHARDWRDLALHDSAEESASCFRCGEVLANNAALVRFYCTVYLDGKNRRDYKSQYCPTCLSTIMSEFEIDV